MCDFKVFVSVRESPHCPPELRKRLFGALLAAEHPGRMGRERSGPSVGAGNVLLAFSLPDFQISNLIQTEPPASVFLGCFVLFCFS